MHTKANSTPDARHRLFSMDGWAIFLALLAALLVRAGVVKHIPW